MQLQDQLEVQSFGFARSRCAMEVINGEVPAEQYQRYAESDPVFVSLSKRQETGYLADSI